MRKNTLVPALALVLLSACAGSESVTGPDALSPRAAAAASCENAASSTPCTTPAPASAKPVRTTTLATRSLESGVDGAEGDDRAGGAMGSGN